MNHKYITPFRYMGGKTRSLGVLYKHFPESDIFDDGFGGSACVLLNKPRCKTDIIAEKNDKLRNIYVQVRDNLSEVRSRLRKAIPQIDKDRYVSLREHAHVGTPVDRAVKALIVYSGSFNGQYGSGYHIEAPRRLTLTYKRLQWMSDRLQDVIIYDDVWKVIADYKDNPDVFFYFDPPYVGTEDYYDVGKGRKKEGFGKRTTFVYPF